MSEQANDQSSMFAFPSLGTAQQFTALEDGTGVVTGFPVFRAGNFRDDKGRPASYTGADLSAIVENFKAMREEYPNPPVREDHSRSINSVVGYVDGLHVNDDVLFADFTLTEPRAVERFKRKTYRGRSSEIGAWRVNKDEHKTPFFYGFAFVDIPAVSRLYSAGESEISLYMEAEVPEETAVIEPEGGPVLEAQHVFSVAGAEVTDYAQVQAHIDQLELFASEQRSAGRTAFVTKLVEENRLAAPQMEAMIEFVRTLDDDQYLKWSEAMAGAAPLAAFGEVGPSDTQSTDGENPRLIALADAQETVRMHRLAGMDEDILKETDSYKKMISLQEEK